MARSLDTTATAAAHTGSGSAVNDNGTDAKETPNGAVSQKRTQTQAIQDDRERYLPRGVFTYHPVYPASGAGARITDVDGNSYLDFAGGIGTMNVGHSHPAVVAAIHEQVDLYTHT
ncbi:MAG: aminotransferase class III-fold pyridoxal phosphate-dependent enzyme, partial [Ktedonobacterales bacterium]